MRCLASLSVYSTEMSVEDMCQLVPVAPDETRQKGTPHSRHPTSVQRYSWLNFRSHVDRVSPPKEHIENLVSRLEPAMAELGALAERVRREEPATPPARVTLVVETTREEFGFGVPQEMLRSMLSLGVDFGVEIDIVDEL